MARIRQITALLFLILVCSLALYNKVFANEYDRDAVSVSEQIKDLRQEIERLKNSSIDNSRGDRYTGIQDTIKRNTIKQLNKEITALEKLLCISCRLVASYADIANLYVRDLSDKILPAMVILFASLVGLWVIIQAYKMMMGLVRPEELYRELVYIAIATIMLTGFGADFINNVYHASLSLIGSASEIAFVLADKPDLDAVGISTEVQEYQNLMSLIYTVEQSVRKVHNLAVSILGDVSILNIFYALILILPYFLVGVVYFSQLVISIFRLMILAALSPFLMLGYAFNWGRPMMHSAIRTLLSSITIMFAVTAAVAMVVYAVDRQDINALSAEINIMDTNLILLIILGWMSTAFMAEATHIANSVTGSSLSNTGVGIITAGATATAGMAWAQRGRVNPMSWGRGYSNMKNSIGAGTAGFGEIRRDAGSLYQRVKDVSRGVKK